MNTKMLLSAALSSSIVLIKIAQLKCSRRVSTIHLWVGGGGGGNSLAAAVNVADPRRANYPQLTKERTLVDARDEFTSSAWAYLIFPAYSDGCNLFRTPLPVWWRWSVLDTRTISPVLRQLHWQPERQRVHFKVATFVHRCLAFRHRIVRVRCG